MGNRQITTNAASGSWLPRTRNRQTTRTSQSTLCTGILGVVGMLRKRFALTEALYANKPRLRSGLLVAWAATCSRVMPSLDHRQSPQTPLSAVASCGVTANRFETSKIGPPKRLVLR